MSHTSRAQRDGPVGEGTCPYAWQPEFNPEDPQGGRREPTSLNCPLTLPSVLRRGRTRAGLSIYTAVWMDIHTQHKTTVEKKCHNQTILSLRGNKKDSSPT